MVLPCFDVFDQESIQDRLIAAGEKGDLSSIRKLLQKSRASDVNFFLKVSINEEYFFYN